MLETIHRWPEVFIHKNCWKDVFWYSFKNQSIILYWRFIWWVVGCFQHLFASKRLKLSKRVRDLSRIKIALFSTINIYFWVSWDYKEGFRLKYVLIPALIKEQYDLQPIHLATHQLSYFFFKLWFFYGFHHCFMFANKRY